MLNLKLTVLINSDKKMACNAGLFRGRTNVFFFNANYLYLPLQNKTYTNYNTVFIYLLILYTDVTYKLQLQLHTITIIYISEGKIIKKTV